MGLFSRIARSTELASGMAQRVGADFGAAILASPEVEAQKYRSIVMRCSGCRQQGACTALQAANDHLDCAPDYCLNKPELDARAGH